MKRGQITIFIIVGIILILFISLIFTILPKKEKLDPEKEKVVVKNYVQSCLSSVADEAFLLLGKQGRVYVDNYLYTDQGPIEYFYYEGENKMVSLETLEKDVSTYIEENIDWCLGNFESFNYEIKTEGKPKVETSFNAFDTYIDMEYTVLIRTKESLIELRYFSKRSDLRIKYIYDFISEIVDKTVQDKQLLDTNFIISEKSLKFKLYPIDSEKVVYEIIDSVKKLNNEDYKFRFALKFKW